MTRNALKLVLISLLISLLAACGDSSQTAPAPPSDVTVQPGPGRVTVSWKDNSDNEESFVIYRQVAANEETEFDVHAETAANITTFDDTEVAPGEAYLYKVAARAANQEALAPEVSSPVVAEPPTATLSVSWLGMGEGRLVSEPAGLECQVGETCAASFELGTDISLSVTPGSSSRFLGWGGACEGADACNLTLNGSTEVTASLQKLETLTVLRAGQGSGVVISDPAGIECTPDGLGCSAQFAAGTSVTLTATPGEKSVFTSWSGACEGESCVVEITEPKTVTATFEEQTYTLSVEKTGPGAGEVTSISPAGIDCGDDCAEAFVEGTVVSLQASAASGSRFTGWQGGCSGTVSCRVTLSADQKVSAGFTYLPPTIESLSVAQPNLARGKSTTLNWKVTGQGELELSIDGGVGNVTDKESASVAPRQTTTYTLKAKSQYGETTAKVTVKVGDAPSLGTSFQAKPATISRGESTVLSWSVSGDAPMKLSLAPGVGEVSGTKVLLEPIKTTTYTLTASNAFGTAEATTKVTVRPAFEIKVNVTGEKGGRVASVPSGINCGNGRVSCSAIFDRNKFVSLYALEGSFKGWKNCPQEAGRICDITVTSDRTVTAEFR